MRTIKNSDIVPFLVITFILLCHCQWKPAVNNPEQNEATILEGENTLSYEKLMERLFDPHDEARVIAVRKLALLGESRAAPALIHVLQVDTNKVKVHAARALAFYPGEKTVSALINALRIEDRQVEKAVIESLVTIGNPARGLLQKSIRSSDERIKLLSLHVLGKIAHPEDFPLIKDFFLSENEKEVTIAAQGILQYNSEGINFLLQQFVSGTKELQVEQAAIALAYYPEASRDVFLEALEKGNLMQQASAIEALRIFGDSTSEEIIFPFLQSDANKLVLHSVLALAEIGTTKAIGPLSEAKKRKDPLLDQLIDFSLEKITSRMSEKED